MITDHQQELIEALVSSGRYQNASEVLREGLRLVEQREDEDAAKLKALRAAVDEGFAAYDRGEYVEINTEQDAAALWASIDAAVKGRVRPATKAG